jgi:hypothetical protein
LFVCWTIPLTTFAYRAGFEGLLISDKLADPPIPITLSLEVNLATVSGKVKTKLPLPGEGVLYGDEQFGTCALRSDLGGLTLLTMKGSCGPSLPSFDGKYLLKLKDGTRQTGTFKLTKVRADKPAPEKYPGAADRQSSEFSGSTPAQCIRANSACLVACPRGDYNAELLCVNHCKRNYSTCKGARSHPAGMSDTPGSQ